MNNKDSKLVFNSFIAKQLLTKYNHKIIDIKKHRETNNVIFVFENDSLLEKDILKIKNDSMKGDKNNENVSKIQSDNAS